MNVNLEIILDSLISNFSPYSIFLYGSKATCSDNNKSDYEIGVIFEDDKYVTRQEISNLINHKDYAIFPFKLSEVINYDIDTPFQKNIYLNVLINGGSKTLYGKPILQDLNAPKITVDDLLADINFNLGVALSAVRVYKSGNTELANDMFYKSCFYVTRDLIYCLSKKLCLSYNEIYESSKKIEIPNEYKEILDIAHSLRNNENIEFSTKIYFKNISYINKFILKRVSKYKTGLLT